MGKEWGGEERGTVERGREGEERGTVERGREGRRGVQWRGEGKERRGVQWRGEGKGGVREEGTKSGRKDGDGRQRGEETGRTGAILYVANIYCTVRTIKTRYQFSVNVTIFMMRTEDALIREIVQVLALHKIPFIRT